MDDLNEKLDRVSRRMQEERDRVRRALEPHPDLLHLAELAKKTFQARFTYLKTETYEKGENLPPGIVPARYNKPPSGKRRIAWLRNVEKQ